MMKAKMFYALFIPLHIIYAPQFTHLLLFFTNFATSFLLPSYCMKKIYFAGSIRGGRIDASLYGRLIKYIQRTDMVLTEHIGCTDLNLKEQGKRDADIFNQDMAWLRECDIIIAECTCPSLGVGYELASGEKYGKPCHIFYNRTRTSLSAMLTGNPYFTIHPYDDENEIYPIIDKII